jgi:mono/diheme cytochrome c family protein
MPPFAHILDDNGVAAVVTYIRVRGRTRARPSRPKQVSELRTLAPE